MHSIIWRNMFYKINKAAINEKKTTQFHVVNCNVAQTMKELLLFFIHCICYRGRNK